jgi:hypothetical protein
MIKCVTISGCRYTFDDELYLVVIISLLQKPYKRSGYYSNGLFRKSFVYARKSVLRCRMEMADIAQKVCPGLVFYSKDQVWKKDSGLYDGKRIIYRVGGWNFRHDVYSGYIIPIGEEINDMLDCGLQQGENFMDLLVRKGLAEQLHLTKMTKGIPRCHYPLLHEHTEYDDEENEYWQGRKSIDPVNMPRYYDN